MKQKQNIQSFTALCNKISRDLRSKIKVIYPAHKPSKIPSHVRSNDYTAIWDTGATGSVVTKKVVNDLGLQPINKILVNGVHGECYSNLYLVNMLLPNNVHYCAVHVTEAEQLGRIDDNIDVLIGMNIISSGDLAVTNYNGRTAFSFRFPSTEFIDFTKNTSVE